MKDNRIRKSKLVLRKESIARLTTTELSRVLGARATLAIYFTTCDTVGTGITPDYSNCIDCSNGC